MKTCLFAVILLLIFAIPAFAQDQPLPTQGVFLGIGYSQVGTPQLFGSAAYFHQVKDALYLYSGYNITPTAETFSLGTLTLRKLKYEAFSGLTYRAAQINKLSLWVLGTGGLAANGEQLSASLGAGGFGLVPIGKGFGILLGGQVNRDAITGTDGALRVGFTYSK